MQNIFLKIIVSMCLFLFLSVLFGNAIVAQNENEKQAMEQFHKMAVNHYAFEQPSNSSSSTGTLRGGISASSNTSSGSSSSASIPTQSFVLYTGSQKTVTGRGRFYKMPVGTTMIGKQPSASSNSAPPVSSSSSSSVSSTNLSSPNYIPAETSEITQYVPINTSYSFYDVSPFNGCGAEGSGFNPPDKIQVIYSSIVPASEKVQLFSAVIETLKKGGEEFVPVWYAPPHPNGKITEVFDLAEIACNPHDIEYGTLGFPKEKADQNFYDRMISAGVPPAIADMYYKAVKELGQSAYDEGQNRARTKANAQDHIHFFADDGSYNVGYFDDGIHGIDKSNNAKVLGGDYDVSIMKTAKERLAKLPTKWTAENYVLKGDNHQNCQDFADALIIEYNKIKDELQMIKDSTTEYAKLRRNAALAGGQQLANLVTQVNAIDISKCSEEFRKSFGEYRTVWTNGLQALQNRDINKLIQVNKEKRVKAKTLQETCKKYCEEYNITLQEQFSELFLRYISEDCE